MPATTDVSICNSALRKIHETPINALSENDSCEHFYPLIRDEMLERHDWSFATRRAQLASTTDTVIGESTLNVYEFPVNPYCLRIIEVINQSGDWQVEQRQLLTATSSPINIRYVAREQEDKFPIYFVQALATRLASELAVDSGAAAQMLVLLDQQLNAPGGLWDKAVHADIREKQAGQVPGTRRAALWVDAHRR